MGCTSSKALAAPPSFDVPGGGSMIIGSAAPAPAKPAADAPDLLRSKGGSYIMGRKYAGAWEPGAPVVPPAPTTETKYAYLRADGSVLRIAYGAGSEQGRAPRPPMKPNQDAFFGMEAVGNNPNTAMFAVFDGHGPRGEDAAAFCRVNLPDVCVRHPLFSRNPFEALIASFEATHRKFISNATQKAGVDTAVSGSTAVVVMFNGSQWVCANLGDSRAMLASVGPDGTLQAKPISDDHKPSRPDERARIARSSGRILSEKALGIENGDANKLYVCRIHNANIRYGVLFTRSIGDADAHAHLGLTAIPEVRRAALDPSSDRFMVLATDGVWDFLSEEEVAALVVEAGGLENAHAAAQHIVATAKARWDAEPDGRRDDITAVVIAFKQLSAEAAEADMAVHAGVRLCGDVPTVAPGSEGGASVVTATNVAVAVASEDVAASGSGGGGEEVAGDSGGDSSTSSDVAGGDAGGACCDASSGGDCGGGGSSGGDCGSSSSSD